MEINKWHIVILAAGMLILFLLNNWTPLYGFISCTFNVFDCPDAGCGFDGNCTSQLAEQVKDECCMEVDLCSGYTTQNPSECYHRYCTNPGQMCVPVQVGETQELNYECKCQSTQI